MKKSTYITAAITLFFFALLYVEETPFTSLFTFIASGYCLQKGGIVNWMEEIKKPY